MPLRTYLRKRRDIAKARKPLASEKLSKMTNINPQGSSQFFSLLPVEIREEIYEYALLAYPDLTRPYPKEAYYCRPGYTHARIINTSLLLACRRMYLEIGQTAVEVNEHLIYQPFAHGPPGHRPYLLPGARQAKGGIPTKKKGLIKMEQRNAVREVHIFCPQWWLENWNLNWARYCVGWSTLPSQFRKDDWTEGVAKNGLHPPRLKVTLRHMDWWNFLLGDASPLALDAKRKDRAVAGQLMQDNEPFEDGSWGAYFIHLSGLEEFELELETFANKEAELEKVVKRAASWRFKLGDGSTMHFQKVETSRTTWTGSNVRIPGTEDKDFTARTHDYYAVTLIWRTKPFKKVIDQEALRKAALRVEGWPVDSPFHYSYDKIASMLETQAKEAQEADMPEHGVTSTLEPEAETGEEPADAEPEPGAQGLAQGIFAMNVARNPTRDVIPTNWG